MITRVTDNTIIPVHCAIVYVKSAKKSIPANKTSQFQHPYRHLIPFRVIRFRVENSDTLLQKYLLNSAFIQN